MKNRTEFDEHPERITSSQERKLTNEELALRFGVETKCSAPHIEDGAIVRTTQECVESDRNILTTSYN